jgi:hypothetical protein
VNFLASEEAKETVDVALDLLKRRKIVSVRASKVVNNTKKTDLLEFYSNSLSHLQP